MADRLRLIWPYAYPVLCVVVPCLLYRIGFVRCKGRSFGARFLIWVFILYLFAALDAAGIGSIWEMKGKQPEPGNINLHPFASEGVMTYALNVLMFLPMGFLLCLIWQDYENLLRTLLAGMTFSALIEATQLFNDRCTDVDDLIMNVLGTAAGYALAVAFKGLFKVQSPVDRNASALEPFGYILFAVMGEFLLYNMRWGTL